MYKFCLCVLAGLFPLAMTGPAFPVEPDAKKTKTTVKTEYRVIYNQDCTDLFDTGEKLTPRNVQQMVDDIDVLELDFLRFPYHFEQDNIGQHCKAMTGFIREVRQILDATGRHIALIPRVASSPGAARSLGFDVQAWSREGIVDGITTGSFLGTCWVLAIDVNVR